MKCINGTVDLSVQCEPVFDYARKGGQWHYPGTDYSEVTSTAEGQPTLRLTGSLRMGVEGRIAMARTKLSRGESHYVALTFSELPAPRDKDEAESWMERTSEYWRQWLSQGTFPDHPWRAYLQSSRAGSEGPVLRADRRAAGRGDHLPAGNAWWGTELGLPLRVDPGLHLRPVGPVHPRLRPRGQRLLLLHPRRLPGQPQRPADHVRRRWGATSGRIHADHLSGYDDATPVRIGNGAYNQQQHDVWGALLDSIYLHTRSREQMPEELWPIVIAQVEQASAHWRAPDRGIWEVRGEPQHFTASKIMCWVALDRGVRLARLHDSHAIADKWQAIADEIHADILANGVDDRGVLVQRYGSDALDASLLLAPLVRFLPPDDYRIRATVLAIADELTHEGLVLRYRVEETDDGLAGEEGTFTICSFWLVSALVEIGEDDRATRCASGCSRTPPRSACSPRNSTPSPAGIWATSRRPSPTWR